MFGLSGISARVAEVVLVFGLLFGAGVYTYHKGGENQVQIYKEAQAKRDKEVQAKYDEVVAKYTTLRESREVNAKTVTKYVDKIITRDVYRNECIDDDGLHALNAAIRGEGIRNP